MGYEGEAEEDHERPFEVNAEINRACSVTELGKKIFRVLVQKRQ